MRYPELCQQMNKAGWLAHEMAACNTNYSSGSGKKYFTVKLIHGTETYSAYNALQPVPVFNVSSSVSANILYNDEDGQHEEPVLIDPRLGLLLYKHPKTGDNLIAFLGDIPAERLVYNDPSSQSSGFSASPCRTGFSLTYCHFCE